MIPRRVCLLAELCARQAQGRRIRQSSDWKGISSRFTIFVLFLHVLYTVTTLTTKSLLVSTLRFSLNRIILWEKSVGAANTFRFFPLYKLAVIRRTFVGVLLGPGSGSDCRYLASRHISVLLVLLSCTYSPEWWNSGCFRLTKWQIAALNSLRRYFSRPYDNAPNSPWCTFACYGQVSQFLCRIAYVIITHILLLSAVGNVSSCLAFLFWLLETCVSAI